MEEVTEEDRKTIEETTLGYPLLSLLGGLICHEDSKTKRQDMIRSGKIGRCK